MKKRALVSVFRKNGIVPFAQKLVKLGYEIVSTGGTAKILRDCGIQVIDVSQVTGFPECFDGRVKTLHPMIHGGLLFRSGVTADVEKATELGIQRIDLVVVDLYPFEQAVHEDYARFDHVIEMIDIGGPTMLRAAAKNHQDVIVVCDPADREWVLRELEVNCEVSPERRLALAQKVFATMARYDGAIDQYLGAQQGQITEHLALTNGRELAYAENRCQSPAFIFSGGGHDPLAMTKFRVKAGNPSYIAMADASRLVSTLGLMAEAFRRSFSKVPHIAIAGKHGNPCGAAIDWKSPGTAATKALMGDPLAVMGGELITNFPIDGELGSLIHEIRPDLREVIGRHYWGLDEVLAPEISADTIELLGKKEKRRLLVNPALSMPLFFDHGWVYRQLHGGDWLKQRLSPFVLSSFTVQSWVGQPLESDMLANLLIAFACAWRAVSNTVALANNLKLIGLGCGQQDRLACTRLCLDRASRAKHRILGSVFASDAFFPYAQASPSEGDIDPQSYYGLRPSLEGAEDDQGRRRLLIEFARTILHGDRREGPELLRDDGCIGGVVPADGKHLAEVQQFFKDAKMRVAFVAPENRGFAQH